MLQSLIRSDDIIRPYFGEQLPLDDAPKHFVSFKEEDSNINSLTLLGSNFLSDSHRNEADKYDKVEKEDFDSGLGSTTQWGKLLVNMKNLPSRMSELSLSKCSNQQGFYKLHPDLNKSEGYYSESGKARSNSISDEFKPCYEVFTPKAKDFEKVKYVEPQRRAMDAIAPPSSVERPNYRDTIKRISVVIFQHIQMGERCKELHQLKNKTTYDPVKSNIFNEKNFVCAKYKCLFVRSLGASAGLPSLSFALSKHEVEPEKPSIEQIYDFMMNLFDKALLSSECSIVCLIYIERLIKISGISLLSTNWKPIVLCGLLLSSKVWQDISSWNVEFSNVYPEYNLKSINRLERLYVGQLCWDLCISASLYAKYYFALRSLAEGAGFRKRYNSVVKIDAPLACTVEQRSKAVKEAATSCISKSL